MLDAINRDHGTPRGRSSIIDGGNRFDERRYRGDSPGMIDDINSAFGTPAGRPPVVVHHPLGTEYNPYNDRKYRYDSTGMIDAINRDYPPPLPRQR